LRAIDVVRGGEAEAELGLPAVVADRDADRLQKKFGANSVSGVKKI
jgi:hypothetical protein